MEDSQSKDQTQLAEELSATYQARKNERATIDPHFQNLADYFCPRKSNIIGGARTPDGAKEGQLFDGSGYYALDVAVKGQTSDIIPHDQEWFAFDPPQGLEDNYRVKQWCQEASRIARLLLGGSMFYAQGYEFAADRTCFGTGNFYIEETNDVKRPAVFRAHPMGSYTIGENHDGFVDAVDREFRLTARQMVEKFGIDKVSKKVKEAYEAGKGKQDTQFAIIHSVYPRSEAMRIQGKRDGVNKAFASCYFERDTKHMLRVSGYDEFPHSVSRWATWKGFDNATPWGYSPAWLALPDCRQLNLLQKWLDALVEKKVNPPLLIPQNYKGDIDKRAGGITWFDPNSQADGRPQEWGNNGDYAIGIERVKEKRASIDAFFQVNMWLAITRIDRSNVTAEEVRARVGEQSRQFSATYTLLVTEWLNPMIMAFFRILLKAQMLPPPPQEMIGQDGAGGYYIPEPSITLSSRIALALKDQDNMALSSMLGFFGNVGQFKPDIYDIINWDVAGRDVGRNRGLPPEWNVDPEEVEKTRQARFEQQQEQQQGEQAERLAKAAGNVGKIPSDSPMLQMMGAGQ